MTEFEEIKKSLQEVIVTYEDLIVKMKKIIQTLRMRLVAMDSIENM